MKKVLLLVMLIVSVGTLQAQWSLTPEVGVASSFQINSGDNEWRAGWKLGASVEYDLVPGLFALQSGLFYTNRQSRHSDLYVNSEEGEMIIFENKMKRHFIQMPLMGKFRFKVEENVYFTVGAGLYGAVRVGSRQEWYPGWSLGGYGGGYGYGNGYGNGYYTSNYYGNYDSYAHSDNLRHFDWGLTGAIGLEIKKFVMNLGYDFALGQEFKYGYDSVGAHYHTLSLSVGYKFSIGK